MEDRIILISKDVLMKAYLTPYGNQYFEMPNLSELAQKGTVFNRHYTAAPSTAMAFTSMSTGLYAYQTDRKKYVEVSEFEGKTIYDQLNALGYECHIIWDPRYVYMAQRYSKCYGRQTKIHNIPLTKETPKHRPGKFDEIINNENDKLEAIFNFEKIIRELINNSDKTFVWVHFPHTIAGSNVWGSDMGTFDKMIEVARRYFPDEGIYITADHGHMNGMHGKYGYGFDVFENAICIPLITPRIANYSTIDYPTSNTQLSEIIIDNRITQKEYVLSETAYYMQPHRKLAIIKDNYKYVYEKQTHKEFLYDVLWDAMETTNLISPDVYDTDRRCYFPSNLRWFYPYWNESVRYIDYFRNIKQEMWRDAPWLIESKERIIHRAKFTYSRVMNFIK